MEKKSYLEQLKEAAAEAFNGAVNRSAPKEQIDEQAKMNALIDAALEEQKQKDKDYADMSKAYGASLIHQSFQPESGKDANTDIAPKTTVSFEEFFLNAK